MPKLKVISRHFVELEGRRLDKVSFPSWKSIQASLAPNEKVVAIVLLPDGCSDGVIIENASIYREKLKNDEVRGVYAAGTQLLAKEEPWIRYRGP